jgi:hypothetical protein
MLTIDIYKPEVQQSGRLWQLPQPATPWVLDDYDFLPRILMGISLALEHVPQGTPAQRTSKGCVDKQRSDTICASRRSVRSIVVVGSRAYVYLEHGQLEQRKTSSFQTEVEFS